MTPKASNWVWGAVGAIVTGLIISAWDHIRPMTKVEHDADIGRIDVIEKAVLKIGQHWDCYETRSAINRNLDLQLRTPHDEEELRQLREALKSLDCAAL